MFPKIPFEDRVHFIRLHAPFDKTKMQVQLSAPSWEILDAIRLAVHNEGLGQIHTGTPPPGWLD